MCDEAGENPVYTCEYLTPKQTHEDNAAIGIILQETVDISIPNIIIIKRTHAAKSMQ